MKYIFGGIITLLLLATLAFYLLGLWGVEIPVTSADLTKAWITGLVVLGALLVFTASCPSSSAVAPTATISLRALSLSARRTKDYSLIIIGHGLHLYRVEMEVVTFCSWWLLSWVVRETTCGRGA